MNIINPTASEEKALIAGLDIINEIIHEYGIYSINRWDYDDVVVIEIYNEDGQAVRYAMDIKEQ